MKEMVRVQGIKKVFDDTVVIPGLDLIINDGEFLTLLGPSGCGKTTLLRMIAGLETPTEGTIYLDGKDMTKLPPYKRDVNMVFQNYALFPHMDVEENIRFGLKMKQVPKDEQDVRVEKLLKLTHLEKFRHRFPSEMSGGQQQRVSVARAIIIQPSILLADEPTGNLDDENASRLMDLFIKMNKTFGTTIILATHNKKLLDTYKFPVIMVENHHVAFSGINNTNDSESGRKWKGPKPQSDFMEISKQFENIGNA